MKYLKYSAIISENNISNNGYGIEIHNFNAANG